MQQRKRNRSRSQSTRPPASKAEVANLKLQVEKISEEVKNKNRRNGRSPRRTRSRRRGTGERTSNIVSYDQRSAARLKQKGTYNEMWNTYLNGVLDPTIKNQYIPDPSLFPFTTSQAVTICEVTVGTTGAFEMLFQCTPDNTAYFFDGDNGGSVSVDGVTIVNDQSANNALYDTFLTTVFGWRIVSMQIEIKYNGKPFDGSGRIATACLPSMEFAEASDVLSSYTSLARYNYAYTGRAIEGATQVWFPGGARSRQIYQTDGNVAFNAFPLLAMAADGLQPNTKVFQVTITQNYEMYTTSQLLTGHRARKTSTPMMDHASSTLSRVYKRDGGGHSGATPHKEWWQTALSVGKDVAEIALPIISMLL